MDKVHSVFHVSMLRKYLYDESHVLEPHTVEIGRDLSYLEQPVAVVGRETKKLRSRWVPSVKVVWQYHEGQKATGSLSKL